MRKLILNKKNEIEQPDFEMNNDFPTDFVIIEEDLIDEKQELLSSFCKFGFRFDLIRDEIDFDCEPSNENISCS